MRFRTGVSGLASPPHYWGVVVVEFGVVVVSFGVVEVGEVVDPVEGLTPVVPGAALPGVPVVVVPDVELGEFPLTVLVPFMPGFPFTSVLPVVPLIPVALPVVDPVVPVEPVVPV